MPDTPNKGKQLPPKEEPKTDKAQLPAPEKKPVEKPKEQSPKTPASKKDDRFKYEMTYVNGGFNNGVEVKPDKDGKANVEISIYGGGDKKTLTVGPLPPKIEKLVKAYELSANQDQNTPEITTELQTYFAQIQTLLNAKVLEIFKQMDLQIADAIKSAFKQVNDSNI